MERKAGKSILKRSTNRKDKAMKTPVKTDTKDEVVKRDELRHDPVQERAPDRDVTNTKPKQADPRDDIKKQIADHEKWMSDHTDDARGVQERLQEIAQLQNKLGELDQPKHETRVRQGQTV